MHSKRTEKALLDIIFSFQKTMYYVILLTWMLLPNGHHEVDIQVKRIWILIIVVRWAFVLSLEALKSRQSNPPITILLQREKVNSIWGQITARFSSLKDWGLLPKNEKNFLGRRRRKKKKSATAGETFINLVGETERSNLGWSHRCWLY